MDEVTRAPAAAAAGSREPREVACAVGLRERRRAAPLRTQARRSVVVLARAAAGHALYERLCVCVRATPRLLVLLVARLSLSRPSCSVSLAFDRAVLAPLCRRRI